jgi:superfamily II DNA or RNA helicase
VEAYENWKNNKQKGLFAMATGTGKTLTALNCLLNIYQKFRFYKAIILVPTLTLVDQWKEECRKFDFTRIVKVCSKNRIGKVNWTP